MARLQSQAHNEQRDDFDNVLRSFHEWMAEKAQADRNGKIFSARHSTAGQSSYVPPSVASPGPSIVPNQRVMSEEISGNKPSVGRRVFRTFAYGLAVAALVAVAWQAYSDDETRKMMRAWKHSSLTWLSSLSGHKSSVGPHLATASTPKSSDQAAALAQLGPAPTGTDMPREVHQQLQAAVGDLAVIRRTVEQIASKQEQMAQDIATLQATERDINQKIISSLAQAAPVRTARKSVPGMVPSDHAGQPASAALPASPPSPRMPPPAQ